jgi:hypothetical protein
MTHIGFVITFKIIKFYHEKTEEIKMNNDDFSQKTRTILTILIVVYGLFVIIGGPFLIQGSLDAILARVVPKIPKEPSFAMTAVLLPIFFFIMRAIDFVAGVTLIVIAVPFYKGEKWTWPVALSALSLPTLFGVLTSLPHIVQYGRPPAAGLLLLFGLIVYWLVLLLRKGTKVEKWARFLTFTLLGVTAGHLNVLVLHSLKSLIVREDKPLFTDIMTTVFGFEGPINFIAVVFCIVAIPLLASQHKKLAGWLLATIAGVSVALANYPTHFIRMQTSDFFVAGTLGLALAVVVLVPAFRNALLEEG